MKGLRIFLISLLALMVILFAARKPIKLHLEQLIQVRLLEYINTSPNRLYDYAVDQIDISVVGGNITLKGVKIKPRTVAFEHLQQGKTRSLVEAVVDSVALNGLGLYNLFVKEAIHFRRIMIGDADIKYTFNSIYEKPDSMVRKPFVLREVFSSKLKKAHIRKVELRNINFATDDIQTEENFLTRFESGEMILQDIYTDEEVMKGTQPFKYVSLELSAKNFVSIKVKGHTARFDAFHLDTRKKEILLKGVEFGPTHFDYNSLAKQFIRSVNDIAADEIRLSGINFESWQNVGWLEIRKMHLTKPRVRVSMDHRWPKPMFERELPQSKIKAIPFPVRIDTISANGGDVYYREIFNDGKPPLVLTFNDVSAHFLNVTNNPELIKADPILHFTATARFLNTGKLNVKSDFRMNDQLNPFHFVMSLQSMSLTTLNPILEGQVHTRVQGQLNKIAMNIHADRKGASGDFVFDYSGLKLELFKVKDTKKGVKVKKNWLVNSLVNPILRTDNHVDEANFKGGNVSYVRPPDVSFFGMIWQCLKEGMVTTMVPGKHDKHKEEKKKSKHKRKSK